MSSNISKTPILGILGSGQLARMTAVASHQYNLNIHIYCTDKETSPAEPFAHYIQKGSFSDLEKILNFVSACDVVTLENEFIDQNILEEIEKKFPNKLFPTAKTFSLIGDKITEKKTFEQSGIPVAPYKKIHNKDDLLSFIEIHSLPIVLKTSKGGYDGYGNFTIKSFSDIDSAFLKLKGELLAEAFIPYKMEVATMVARNKKGEVETYPVAFTEQENHICHVVSVPAPLSKNLEEKIQFYAKTAMEAIDGVGIFAFEFFITHDDNIFLNESAPRPHNSGHYSIEGCATSQFENHMRAVMNYPLGSSRLLAPYVMMLNLLGTQDGLAHLQPIEKFLNITNGHLHLYGKKLSKKGRKMGHFTLTGSDDQKMKEILLTLKSSYEL